MFRDDGDEDPEVLFLESSAWNGGEPTEQNGVIRPGIRLSQLLQFGADWTEALTERG